MTKFRKRMIIIFSSCIILIAFELFALPISKLKSIQVFTDPTLSDLLTDNKALENLQLNHRLWNIDAINSTDYNDYRLIDLTFKITNITILKNAFSDFEIDSAKQLTNRFVMVYGQITPSTIKRVGSETCSIRILMNTKGLSNSDIEAAIRGLTLKSVKSRRVIVGEINYPSYPIKLKIPKDARIDYQE